MGRVKEVQSRKPVKCQICNKEFKQAYNVKRHLDVFHQSFLKLRGFKENITLAEASKLTYHEHMKGIFVSKSLIDSFKKNEGKLTSYFARDECPSETPALSEISYQPASFISDNDPINNTEAIIAAAASISEIPVSSKNSISGEEICQDLIDSSVVSDSSLVEKSNVPFSNETSLAEKAAVEYSSKTIAVNENSNEIIEDSQSPARAGNSADDVENDNVDSQNFLTSFRNRPCDACKSIEKACNYHDIYTRAMGHSLREECQKIIDTECKCVTVGGKCCCVKIVDSLLKKNIGSMDGASASAKHQTNCSGNVQVPEHIENNFFQDEKSGRYFCLLCHRHSRSKNRGYTGDWSTKGYDFKQSWKKNQYMKNHLRSCEHKDSISLKNLEEKNLKPKDASSGISESVTEHLCIVAQLFCSSLLSNRTFPEICLLMDVVGRPMFQDFEKFIHPLGNQQHSKNALGFAKIACYEAIFENFSLKLHTESPVTKDFPKIMLSADKGFCSDDGQRQVILSTYVNESGILEEFLVTAALIKKSTGIGAADHLQEHFEKIGDPRKIVVFSSDADASYVGGNIGMFAILKQRNVFDNRCLYLADFCHKAERLLSNSEQDLGWVQETWRDSQHIVQLLSRQSMKTELQSFASNSDGNFIFFSPVKLSDTRWVEYSHDHIKSILRNVDICLQCLPIIIESGNDYDKIRVENSMKILKTISNPHFLARLLLVDKVVVLVASAEKQAQSSSFGPFMLLNIVKKLRQDFELLLEYDFISIANILSGDFKYSFPFNGKIYTHNVNLNEVNVALALNLRGSNDLDYLTFIKNEFVRYVSILIRDFDKFLDVAEEVKLSVEIFGSDSTLDIESSVFKFRKLFTKLNVEFYLCTNECLGIKKCICVREQLVRFLAHYKVNNLELNYFMSSANTTEVGKLHIVNILRVIEIVLLMKASQSGTERTISVIKDAVQRCYSGTYSHREVKGKDMLNITVCVKQNSDIFRLDKKLAREKFIAAGHRGCLKLNVPNFTQSKVIRSLITKGLKGSYCNVGSGKKPDLCACLDSIKPGSGGISHEAPVAEDLDFECDEMLDSDIMAATDDADLESMEIFDSNIADFADDEILDSGLTRMVDSVILPLAKDSSSDFSRFESESNEVYCFCGGNGQDNYVACDNEDHCSSYLKRLNSEKKMGGDWFHISCLGLSEMPSEDDKWICYPCYSNYGTRKKSSTTFDLLKLDLEWENWAIETIKPDGNCMFSVFGMHLYGSPDHERARKYIMEEMNAIFCNRKYRWDWSLENCPSSKSNNVYDKFVYRIIHYYRDSILGENCDRPITQEDRVLYISKKYEPASSDDDQRQILDKYGGNIEMDLFSILTKKDIWTLQPAQYEGDVCVKYKWIQQYKSPSVQLQDGVLKTEDYLCFFYEFRNNTDGAHYSSIRPKIMGKPVIHPNDKKIYPGRYELT